MLDGVELECDHQHTHAGTAAVVCPVREVVYQGSSIDVPTGGGAGPVASELWRRLSDAHYGRDASGWAVAI